MARRAKDGEKGIKGGEERMAGNLLRMVQM